MKLKETQFGPRSQPIALGVAIAAILAGAVAGCGGKNTSTISETGGGSDASSKSGVVATVSGAPITDQQFVTEAARNPAGLQVLNSVLVGRLVDDKARADGVSVTDSDVDQWITSHSQSNPTLQQLIQTDPSGTRERIKQAIIINRILQKELKITPAAEDAWFKAHRDLFDTPEQVKIIPFIFNSAKKAQDGMDLLKKGSSPRDVASSLGDPSIATNGVTMPPESRQAMLAFPQLRPIVDRLFAPGAKPGTVLGPIPNFPGLGRYTVVQIDSVIPPKKATLEQARDSVANDMIVEQYLKQKLNVPVPPNPTQDFYANTAQRISSRYLFDLLIQANKDHKITISNPAFKAMFEQSMKQAEASEHQASDLAPQPGVPSGAVGDGSPAEPPAGSPAALPAGSAAGSAAGPSSRSSLRSSSGSSGPSRP